MSAEWMSGQNVVEPPGEWSKLTTGKGSDALDPAHVSNRSCSGYEHRNEGVLMALC
ncbi:MAG: hypothetical protein PVH65_13410 [Chloroflexota bacterium]